MQFRFVFMSEDNSAHAEPLAFLFCIYCSNERMNAIVSILFFCAETRKEGNGKIQRMHT